MENAPTTNSNESAPDKRNYTAGTLPTRHNTVTAEVLASLLESNALTSLDSVFRQNTTRLGAVIYRLEREYGWYIERNDIAVDTCDGRVAMVTSYWLPQEAIAQAFDAGARDWIESVKAARAERRQQVGKCKAEAARINAAPRRRKLQDPRQGGLWGAL